MVIRLSNLFNLNVPDYAPLCSLRCRSLVAGSADDGSARLALEVTTGEFVVSHLPLAPTAEYVIPLVRGIWVALEDPKEVRFPATSHLASRTFWADVVVAGFRTGEGAFI